MGDFRKIYHERRWYIAEGNYTIFEVVSEYFSGDEVDHWVECMNTGAKVLEERKKWLEEEA
jgi:hypothetical protein